MHGCGGGELPLPSQQMQALSANLTAAYQHHFKVLCIAEEKPLHSSAATARLSNSRRFITQTQDAIFWAAFGVAKSILLYLRRIAEKIPLSSVKSKIVLSNFRKNLITISESHLISYDSLKKAFYTLFTRDPWNFFLAAESLIKMLSTVWERLGISRAALFVKFGPP